MRANARHTKWVAYGMRVSLAHGLFAELVRLDRRNDYKYNKNNSLGSIHTSAHRTTNTTNNNKQQQRTAPTPTTNSNEKSFEKECKTLTTKEDA